MIARFLLPVSALGVLLCGCSHGDKTTAARSASTNRRINHYELASRVADPLANYGVGTSAGIPDDETIGRYPGAITPPISPVMGIGD